MEQQNYQTAKLDDIVFEGRNKSYGAYVLRQLHEKHVRRGLIVSSLLMLLGFTFPLLAEKFGLYERFAKKDLVVTEVTLEEPPSLDKTKPPPPPPPPTPPPPPPPTKPTIRFVEPEPKKDEEVKKEEPPPPPEELKKADIDVKTKEGDKDAKPVLAPVDDGKGKEEPPPKPVVEDKPKVEEIFTVVEQQPEFPDGGTKGMYEWLGKNIKYPAIARENGIEGKAIVQFVVEPDGSISNVNCVRGPEGGCKEEATRVIKMMPKWIPGKQQGRPVRVRYTLPVVFKLE
jgi:periplasmic protein TonB